MIKRLLILGLVLALPAMASAVTVNLSLVSGGQSSLNLGTDVTVGQVITVDLVCDTAVLGMGSLMSFVPTGETISAPGSFVDASINAAVSNPGVMAGGSITSFGFAVNTGQNVAAGNIIYSFSATVDGVGNIAPVMGTGDFLQPVSGGILFSSGVTQNALYIVPEPATIALLGLGGLLLRRRK